LNVIDLETLSLVVRVAELGSISAAARERDTLPATASAAIMRLEKHAGIAIFTRNTRSLKLTPDGTMLVERLREALQLISEGLAGAHVGGKRLQGHIRLSAPFDFGSQVVRPMIDAFMMLHPEISVSIHLSDRISDLGREPVDLAIRYGAPSDSDIVRKLTNNVRILVASPAYLARHSAPRAIDDLLKHDCILLRLANRPGNIWSLRQGNQVLKIEVQGRRVSDNGLVTRDWAVAGHGIALKSALDVHADLMSGRLIRVLKDVCSEPPFPLYLAFARGMHLSPRILALGEFLADRLKGTTENAVPVSGADSSRN
jgi:DNA-binding transcriptional LysR family regulator